MRRGRYANERRQYRVDAPGNLVADFTALDGHVTIESVVPIGRNRIAIVNDTNFGSRGRKPDLPDYSDFVVIEVPGLG